MDGLDLRKTPTLQLSAPDAAESIVGKLSEELKRVEQDEKVIAARETFVKAGRYFEKNKAAHVALNGRSDELGKFLAEASETYIEQTIEAAGSGGKRPDAKTVARVIDGESEARLVVRAIQRIAEHRIPLAEISALQAEAAWQHAKAGVLDRLASERAQKLVAAMGAAVELEGVLPVDTKGGVAGLLIQLANEARKEAIGLEIQAKELQAKYDERNRKEN